MKTKVLILCILFYGLTQVAFSQRGIRIGYIDMEYILESVPEYQEASSQLETKVQKWKSEIEAQLNEVADMKKELNNEKVLLTKELIEEREEDIYFKEKEIREYQQDRFGPSGDLVVQKKQLVQPVQDQVFTAVQEIATQKKFDFIFDKSADVVMLYSADRHDISDLILRNINRASKRKQLKGKKAKKEIVADEYQSVQEAEALEKRKQLLADKKAEREQLIKKKQEERKAAQNKKLEEYKARKATILEERKRAKDSLIQLRNKKIEEAKLKKTASEDN